MPVSYGHIGGFAMGQSIAKDAAALCLKEMERLRGEAASWQYRILPFSEQGLSTKAADLERVAEQVRPLTQKQDVTVFVLQNADVAIYFKPADKDVVLRITTSLTTMLIPDKKPEELDAKFTTNYSLLDEAEELSTIIMQIDTEPAGEEHALHPNHKKLNPQEVDDAFKKRPERKERIVLLVENEPTLLKTLNSSMPHKQAADKFPLEIIPVGTLQEAMQAYLERAPDVMLIDEDCNAELFTKFVYYLSKRDVGHHIIAISSSSDEGFKQHIASLGSKYVLSKPFTRTLIEEQVMLCPRFKAAL